MAPDPQPLPGSGSKAAPPRKCGCKCIPECNCNCPCACPEHCTCEKGNTEKCKGDCGENQARNLIVSIDGTSNQFGAFNTNVVELHSRITTDDTSLQLTFYSPGIGTYVPPSYTSFRSWKQWFENGVDLAIAWNFEKIIQEAYQWLADNYRTGDRIFLFGFSRGAYQVRTLAGMIEKLGLIHAGNTRLTSFAYELYCSKYKGKLIDSADIMADRFKPTFARDVKVHFVGVWDTVSSVGFVRGKELPLTMSAAHVCFFRHALALDERRVKFLPEYVDTDPSTPDIATNGAVKALRGKGGISNHDTEMPDDPRDDSDIDEPPSLNESVNTLEEEATTTQSESERIPYNIKEVWFAGSHSDIGGGIKNNLQLNLSSAPLLWMENEATSAGLRLKVRQSGGEWKWEDLREDKPTTSLSWTWWPLEYFFIKRLAYRENPSWIWWPFDFLLYNRSEDTTRTPHFGQGRTIAPGQFIHASVAFKAESYRPRAAAPWFGVAQLDAWSSLVGRGDTDDLSWAELWEEHLEMDLFDASFAERAVKELRTSQPSEVSSGPLNRLSFIALSGRGAKTIIKLNFVEDLIKFLTSKEQNIQIASASCLCRLLDSHYGSAVSDQIPVEQLKEMLSHQDLVVQEASFECLSRLAVLPYDDGLLPRIRPVSKLAQDVFSEDTNLWIPILESMLAEKVFRNMPARAASCLARLTARLDTRRAFVEGLFRRQNAGEDINSMSDASALGSSHSEKLRKAVQRVSELLDNPQTQRDGALSLAHFVESDATVTEDIVKKLVSLLRTTRDWKIAQACIICLRCYAKSETVQNMLLDENFVDIMLDMLKPAATSATKQRNGFWFVKSANSFSRSSLSAGIVNSRHMAAQHISSFLNHEPLKSKFRHAQASQYVVDLLVDDQAATRKVGKGCVNAIEDSDFHKDVQNTMRAVLEGPSHKKRFLILVALQHLLGRGRREFLNLDYATAINRIIFNIQEPMGLRLQAVGVFDRAVQHFYLAEDFLKRMCEQDLISKSLSMLETADKHLVSHAVAREECGLDPTEGMGYGGDYRDQLSTPVLGAVMLQSLAIRANWEVDIMSDLISHGAIQKMALASDSGNDDIMKSVSHFIYWLNDDEERRKIMFDSKIVPRLVKIRDSAKYLSAQVSAAEALASLAGHEDSLQPILDAGALRTMSLDVNIGVSSDNLKEKTSLLTKNLHFLRNLARHQKGVSGIAGASPNLVDIAFELLKVDDLVDAATGFLAIVISHDHLCFANTAKMVATLVKIYYENLEWEVRENVQNILAQYASHDDTRQLVITQDVLKALQEAPKDNSKWRNVGRAGSFFFQNLFENADTARMLVGTHDGLQTLRHLLTSNDWDVCTAGLSVFRKLFESADMRALLATKDVLQDVLQAVSRGLGSISVNVRDSVLSSFRKQLEDVSFREIFCAGSFIQDQVTARDSNSDTWKSLGNQRVLVALAENPDYVPFLLKADAVPKALASDDNDVQVAGCALLQKLAPYDEARSVMLNNGILSRLIAITEDDDWSPQTQKEIRDASRETLQELLKHADVKRWLGNQDESLRAKVAAFVPQVTEDATRARAANEGSEMGPTPDPGEVAESPDPENLVPSDGRTRPSEGSPLVDV